MSQEMGVSRDGLVSQAVFMLGRLNGYVIPGKASAAPGAAMASAPVAPRVAPNARPTGMIAKPVATPVAPPKRPPPDPLEEDEPLPESSGSDDLPQDEAGNPFEDSNMGSAPSGGEEDEAPPPPEEDDAEVSPAVRKSAGPALTLIMVGREPFRVHGDTMVLGRGKHCDFVIESNRVSREHARLSREGSDWTIEDLGSSNGTFYGSSKEKITRRKIKDGDEYTFGTEKVKMSVRAR